MLLVTECVYYTIYVITRYRKTIVIIPILINESTFWIVGRKEMIAANSDDIFLRLTKKDNCADVVMLIIGQKQGLSLTFPTGLSPVFHSSFLHSSKVFKSSSSFRMAHRYMQLS